MRDRSLRLLFGGIFLAACLTGGMAQTAPETAIRPFVENFFGKEVVDPYRWLENLKDPEVLDWLRRQNDHTRSLLDRLPERVEVFNRIIELDKQSPPPIRNLTADKRGRLYYLRNGPDGVARAYIRDIENDAEHVVIDPEKIDATGRRSLLITSLSPSPDGRYIAFVVRDAGQPRLYVIESTTGRLIGAPVSGILGFTGLDWDSDSKSLYIVKLPNTGVDRGTSQTFIRCSAFRHIVGSDPTTDEPIVVTGQNPGFLLANTSFPFVFPIPNTKLLAVWIEDGSRSGHALYISPRSDVIAGKGKWKKIADFDDGATKAVFHANTAYLNVPGKDDGKPRIAAIDLVKGDIGSAKLFELPGILNNVEAASDGLYVTSNVSGKDAFYRVSFDGKSTKIEPPLPGAVDPIFVSPWRRGGIFLIASWTEPPAIYSYKFGKGWEDFKLQPKSDLGRTPDLVSTYVNVRSHDGVEVPLTIIHRKGMKPDSNNPTYLIGYGSYGATASPSFDNLFVPWFEAGGILAYAHVRGGGELGEAWHLSGSKEKKPNTWLDFIACAQYLIDKKYTSPERLAGGGISAGGILIGRAITERPDLFRAALISVGTTDMLRAEHQMNGPANVVEFGTTNDQKGFEQLFKMSAYHHVVPGKRYPAVLLTTGMRDPNVDVWQPAKMTARLQAVATSDRPVLLRVDPEAGHDHYGSTRVQMQQWRADQLAFLIWQLGMGK